MRINFSTARRSTKDKRREQDQTKGFNSILKQLQIPQNRQKKMIRQELKIFSRKI